MIIVKDGNKDILALIGAASLNLKFYKTDREPSNCDVLSDYDQDSDFSQTLVWGTPVASGCGAKMLAQPVLWVTSGADVVPVTIYGYIIYDAVAMVLVAAHRFAAPVDLNVLGDAVLAQPELALGC